MGAHPLDESQPTGSRPESEPPPESGPPPEDSARPKAPPEAPGLRDQIGATQEAAKRLIGAHVELGKAEFGDIADELKRAAILAGIAVAAGIAAGLLLSVGLPLFLGEWIFGSMGWGLLHGLLLLLAIAVAGALLALRVSPGRIGTSLLAGAVAGLVVALVLGFNLTNNGWGLLGDRILPVAAPDVRPLAAALVVLPIVAGLLFGLLSFAQALVSEEARAELDPPAFGGRAAVALPAALYIAWLAAFAYSYLSGRPMFDWSIVGVGVGVFIAEIVLLGVVGAWRPGYALVTGLSIGAVLGVILAPLSAIALGNRVAAAIGLTIGLGVWSAMMGIEAARRGIDVEDLKVRFIPQRTIDMTKETIEWARARMPLSRRS